MCSQFFKCLSFFVLISCLTESFIVLPNAPRRVVKVLKATNGAHFGYWGLTQFCAEGTYAVGYQLKVKIVTRVKI